MRKHMNGTIIDPTSKSFTPEQIACIDALKEALALALEGEVDCLGIAVCLKGGYSSHIAGNRPGELMLAAFDMQCKIREATLEAPKTAQVSRIVRARTV